MKTPCAAMLVLLLGAAAPARDLGVLPCDELSQVKTLVTLDEAVTAEGKGSIKVEAVRGCVITVAARQGLSVKEGNTFWCSLRVKSKGVKKRAYLEMWCDFGEKGRSFSKGLDQALQGDTDWREIRLPMMVNVPATLGQVFINLVIEGEGTVWVDDIRLSAVSGLSATR